MSIEAPDRLRLAVAAMRHGGGPARVAAKARRDGDGAFDEILRDLTAEQTAAVVAKADQLLGAGVDALLLGQAGYPASLAQTRVAPPVLFVSGPRHLLDLPGLGVCGSRRASDSGLRGAKACAEVGAAQGFSIVSGYARGVDMASHTAALAGGGRTVIVLAEGIEHFKIRRGDFADVWDPQRAVVVSQFSPSQPWNAGAAMTRNAVISGLSKAVVVIEAGATGGTLAAGLQALERGQPVLVLQLSDRALEGSQLLVQKGATPVRARTELKSYLGDLPVNAGTQLTLI